MKLIILKIVKPTCFIQIISTACGKIVIKHCGMRMTYARGWENVFVRNQRSWLSCFKSRNGGVTTTTGKGEMKEVTLYTPRFVRPFFSPTMSTQGPCPQGEKKEREEKKGPPKVSGCS